MPGSSFGEAFKVTTFGESHGPAVGVIVDGVTPGVPIDEAYIQKQMDRRKPGQSSVTTPRMEYDVIRILSGVFEGLTTGAPLAIQLVNHDMRPSAYDDIRRLTLERRGVQVVAYTKAIGGIDCRIFDESAIEANAVRACDPVAAARMIRLVEELAARGDSCGGIVECRMRGASPGLGEPAFDKLDAELAKAMLSIGAVKGIEFGAGFAAAGMRGSEHNDEMDANGFRSNCAGGILGGISTGQEIVFRVAVKPTSSISAPQRTVDTDGVEREIRTEGRHNPCICPRVVPVVEAMACLVLEDMYKRQAALLG